MSLHFTAFTAQGIALAQKMMAHQGGSLTVPQRLAEKHQLPGYPSLDHWAKAHFSPGEALVFVGACGIAVRAIAPYVADKGSDPAVVVVDQLGQVVIPLLSGHVGGANALAVTLAEILGAIPAIGTATDLAGKLAIDLWAQEKGLVLSDRILAKQVSAQVLEGATIALLSDFPLNTALPPGMTLGGEGVPVHLTLSASPVTALRLIPQILHLGIGCRKGKSQEDIAQAVESVLQQANLSPLAVASVGSIHLKAEEPGLLAFCQQGHLPFHTFSAEELEQQEGDFTPSAFVASITGVDNVCERSAVALGGQLLLGKQARDGVTVAVSQRSYSLE